MESVVSIGNWSRIVACLETCDERERRREGGKAHKHPDLGVPIGHITSNGRRRAGEQRSQFSASWLCVCVRERAQLAHPRLAVISSATSCANSFRTSLRTNFAL